MSSTVKLEEDIQANKLTQCFNDIMKAATEMMVQQQLKTIQLNSDVASGFRKSLSKSLDDKVRLFHSILDSVDTTLTTASQYLDTVDEMATKMKQWKVQQEAELRRKQLEDLEKSKKLEEQKVVATEQQKQQHISNQSPADVMVRTPGGLMAELDTPHLGSQENIRPLAEKPFSAEFGDFNDMDLSMFGGMDGQNDFSLEDFNMGNPTVTNQNNNDGKRIGNDSIDPTRETNAANNDGNGGNVSSAARMTGNSVENNNKGKDIHPDNDINAMKSSNHTINIHNNSLRPQVGEQDAKQGSQQGPNALSTDDYLTLNDFNDLGIDWNTGDNKELDLNDFNI